MKEYVVLIVGDADRWWTSMTEEERQPGMPSTAVSTKSSPSVVTPITGGAELQGRATAKSIPSGGGPVTDGPFAESAEQVGGFYQVQTEDLDDLLECCQLLAELGDGIEVRPVDTQEDRES